MKIAAYCGNSIHAPENSRISFISAYTSGAQVVEFPLTNTKDKHIVICSDEFITRITGTSERVNNLSLEKLQQLNLAINFKPRNSPSFVYYNPKTSRRISIETLASMLNYLPHDIELLIELTFNFSNNNQKEPMIFETIKILESYGYLSQTFFYSRNPNDIVLLNTLAVKLSLDIKVAVVDTGLSIDELDKLIKNTNADGLVIDLEKILDSSGNLTDLGKDIKAKFEAGIFQSKLILHPKNKLIKYEQYEKLQKENFIWSISTSSVIDICKFIRPSVKIINAKFEGQKVNTQMCALGYAKFDSYTHIFQDHGIHIKIDSYDKPTTLSQPIDEIDTRLQILENKVINISKEWPHYSGGGVGFLNGIIGDFIAEVTYTVANVAQSTTLEMAVLNVNPGIHQNRPPTSLRDTNSFYDPHGSPPYVGVEHDEDDGYRINWNLGTDHDNNQYGIPVGDGKTPRGAKLRLERRGQYFSAYYCNPIDTSGKPLDPKDWVCVGVVRNDSLNQMTYIRCVGKRWRKIKNYNPLEYWPIVSNHYTFKNMEVLRFSK